MSAKLPLRKLIDITVSTFLNSPSANVICKRSLKVTNWGNQPKQTVNIPHYSLSPFLLGISSSSPFTYQKQQNLLFNPVWSNTDLSQADTREKLGVQQVDTIGRHDICIRINNVIISLLECFKYTKANKQEFL